jgi:hypothetical protein
MPALSGAKSVRNNAKADNRLSQLRTNIEQPPISNKEMHH